MATTKPTSSPSRQAAQDFWVSSEPFTPSAQIEESYQRMRARQFEERQTRLRQLYGAPLTTAPEGYPVKIGKTLIPMVAPAKKPVKRALRITPSDVREAAVSFNWPSPLAGRPARDYYSVDIPVDTAIQHEVLPPPVRATRPRLPLPEEPVILIGIELEGILRDESSKLFKNALRDLVRDPYGDSLVQFGRDDSVKGWTEGVSSPVEIRTAPMSLERGLVALEEILSFLYLASESGDWMTNETCGFHLNVSEMGVFKRKMQKDLYVNVLEVFNEDDILEVFNREDNRYCLPFWDDSEPPSAEGARLLYDEMKGREMRARDAGSTGRDTRESKYLACSLRDSPVHESYAGPEVTAQRIEFRCIGNTDYHLRFEDLDSSINHMVDSVREAYQAVRAAAQVNPLSVA